jgi:hypothetical protein
MHPREKFNISYLIPVSEKVSHMRATIIVLLVALSMLPLGAILSPQAQGSNIVVENTRFNNGATEANVEFTGGGINSDLGLSLQSGMYVDEVRLKVSSVAQPAGSKAYPSNIGLDFGGDRALEWAWQAPGAGGLGRQSTFLNGKPYMNASINGGGYDDTVAFRMPKTAVVRSAKVNVSAGTTIGQQGKILIMSACYVGYGWDTDPQKRMQAFTSDFSQVDTFDARSKTPTWDDIKDYSAILVYSDGYYGYSFQNSATLGDLLANYVDAGGSVVCAWWCFMQSGNYYLQGRFNTGGYYAIQPSNSYTSSSSGVGTIDIPGHPVMSNVTSISFPYWGYTYRVYNPSVTTGTSIISHWGDGYIMAATKNIGGVDRVDINMWPVNYQASGNYGSYGTIGYSGDGDDLIKNALLFGGRKPVTAKVDILNDSMPEFDRTNFSGNFTTADFSAALNSYIASAPVSYTDKWGNKFVDVPINVSAPGTARVSLGALDVTYDYSIDVDENPGSGNLTLSISDLQQSKLSADNVTIPLYISSSTSGKIKLSNLYVRLTPPIHAPRIDSFYPAAQTTVSEGDSLDLGVNATDIYRNPMTYTWFQDDERLPGTASNRLSLDFGFNDAGTHTVLVKVANGMSDKSYTNMSWTITVLNINRPPGIDSFLPLSDVTLNEGGSQTFSVVASDPDVGDVLTYSWFIDGNSLPDVTGDNFTYNPGYFDSGLHTFKVVVTDGSGATDFKTWQATIIDINVVPMIQAWTPRDDPRITETETVEFGITAYDPDKDDRVTIDWYFDDALVFVGNPYTYISDYKSAGKHIVKATATDGEGLSDHTWNLTVDNLNRPPFPAIFSPLNGSEYMDGQAIAFSAKYTSDPDNETLRFSWMEGGVNVSDQMEFERAFPPGIHTITLIVTDQAGASATASVRFRVRYVEISTSIGLDKFDVQAGNHVSVILTMSNIGDANATDLPVSIKVDGISIGATTIKDFSPGGLEKMVFQWKATKGPHTITATVGEQTWTKEITVAAAAAPAASGGIGDYMWTILIVVIAIALIGFGFWVLKKK